MANTSDIEIINKFKEHSLSHKTDMLSKEIAWIPDTNGSSYNGQITFDLSSLGTSNKWISYSEAYIQIPYIIQAKATDNYNAIINSGTIYMKDGFHQLIDSIAVEINQKTVQQVQNFTNMHTQFKLLTSYSYEDLIKNSATTGFYGDVYDNYQFKEAADVLGIGYINNTDTLRKSRTTQYDLDAYVTKTPSLKRDEVIKSGRSYYISEGTLASTVYTWVVMATIRLKDICDVFDKLPLCKTSDIKLNITYNASNVTIASAADQKLTISSYQQVSGHICPFMVSTSTAFAANSSLTIQSNVIKSGLSGAVDPTLAFNNCRFYVPIYKINDSVALSMITTHPSTKIVYNDIYTYNINDITTGSNFNYTLTTGITNPKYLVIMPVPHTNRIIGVSTYQSVFDSAGGTTSNVILGELNVSIAGTNVFQQNERYSFEQFIDELSKINANFGNNVTGLTSGILDFNAFQGIYRMYVCDLSRREPSGDTVTKSVVISGINTSTVSIDLICFIAYEKKLSIKTATGITEE